MNRTLRTAAFSLFAVMATTAAQAADAMSCRFSHPAVARSTTCAASVGIDANTFVVQPPASTRWLASADSARSPVHANHAHPAVAVARMQPTAGVNANTFIVQPPAMVSWTVVAPAPVLAGMPVNAAR